MIRVLIADDEPLVRGGIRMLLSGLDDIAVVAESVDGPATVDLARQLRPNVVLMDLKMPGLDGIEAARRLAADAPDPGAETVSVLVLTSFHDEAAVVGALRAGASGFLLKENAPDHLVDAIRTVFGGDAWLDPSVAGQVVRALRAAAPSSQVVRARLDSLTVREGEVLVLMARGLSNAEIADRFVVSEATVRTHVSRILMKTGTGNRTNAVVLAYQSGFA